MKKRFLLVAVMSLIVFCFFATLAYASEDAPESYIESDDAYTIYTDSQYKEVILGVYNGTLENKTIVFGCDISVTLDLYMEKPCDISIDLNGFTYTNNYRPVKTGDFDLRHKDAIIRIKNGNMKSSFCVFIFQTNSNAEYANDDNMGQVYLENVNIDSQEEVIYAYGGYGGILSFKNCNMNVIGDYKVSGGGKCGTNLGVLYQIEGGSYDGFNFHCARDGSYMRDCTVYSQELFVDSWHQHGGENNNADSTVVFTNVVVETQFRLNDERVDPVLYDCSVPKFVLTGGKQTVISYTSPTCDAPGTKTTYFNSADNVTVDEQYSIDNPATGHKPSDTVIERYFAKTSDGASNYFENQLIISPCANCGTQNEFTLENTSLFTKKGYSYSQYDASTVSYTIYINREAIESYNPALLYGIVVSANPSGAPISYIDGAISHDNKTIAMEFQSTDVAYSIITAKLTNVAENTELHLGAYCVDNGAVSYLGHDTVSAICEAISYAILTEKYPSGRDD